ncbi:unnamed protein product [Boreogadus saida]
MSHVEEKTSWCHPAFECNTSGCRQAGREELQPSSTAEREAQLHGPTLPKHSLATPGVLVGAVAEMAGLQMNQGSGSFDSSNRAR